MRTQSSNPLSAITLPSTITKMRVGHYIAVLTAILLLSSAAHAYTFADYDWIEHDGHLYALTLDYSNWQTAQSWAEEVGGHLAIINDAAENAWLAETFKGTGLRTQSSNSLNSLVWIGLICPEGNKADLSNWYWVTGEPLTYSASWYVGTPRYDADAGVHAYLHTNTHFVRGSWWNNGGIDRNPDYHPLGIIEIDNPFAVVEATLDVDPDTLNLGSNGKWITCYMTLPEPYTVDDVDPTSILLDELIAPAWTMIDEEEQVLEIKFDRAATQELLVTGEVELMVTGLLTGEILFEGFDTIRVIDPTNVDE